MSRLSPRSRPLTTTPFAPHLPTAEPIGLIAGWGCFPWRVAEALRHKGHAVICAGIREHADAELAHECHEFQWVGLAQLGRLIRYFRRRGVRVVTMAGKIHKTRLFARDFWWRNIPDLRTLRVFFPHFFTHHRTRTDDSLLMAVVAEFQRAGIHVQPATELAPELLMPEGHFLRTILTTRQRNDVAFGWRMAKALGELDIGQTVAVKGQAVLAVEAIEGTDACIRRAGQLCPAGDFTVVKVAKPQQDMRFDVPTIGLATIQTMWQAGATLLAIEADKTILIDRSEVLRFAENNGISIVVLRDGALAEPVLAAA